MNGWLKSTKASNGETGGGGGGVSGSRGKLAGRGANSSGGKGESLDFGSRSNNNNSASFRLSSNGCGNSGEWLLSHPVFGTSASDAVWPSGGVGLDAAADPGAGSKTEMWKRRSDPEAGSSGGGLGLLFDPQRSTVSVCEKCFHLYEVLRMQSSFGW